MFLTLSADQEEVFSVLERIITGSSDFLKTVIKCFIEKFLSAGSFAQERKSKVILKSPVIMIVDLNET